MELKTVMKIEIPENFGSFQGIEEKIRGSVFQAGLELMNQLFEWYEVWILEKKKSFQKKDRRAKGIQTLIGEIKRERWRVWDLKEKRYRYPLDEWLGLRRHEKVTEGLTGKLVEAMVQRAYRAGTREVMQWTNVKRTPLANWKVVQKVAEERMGQGGQLPEWARQPIPALHPGMKLDPCPILAIDPDGTYCHSQEKLGKDHEVKMAVMYTGKQGEGRNKKKWSLVNKRVVFSRSRESLEHFLNRVTHLAITHYGAHVGSQGNRYCRLLRKSGAR